MVHGFGCFGDVGSVSSTFPFVPSCGLVEDCWTDQFDMTLLVKWPKGLGTSI